MSETARKRPHALSPDADTVFQDGPENARIYHNNFRGCTLDPERALLLAVLQDAIDRCDIAWLNDPGYEPWGFSFEYVCEHLELEPHYIRTGVLKHLSLHQVPNLSSTPDSSARLS